MQHLTGSAEEVPELPWPPEQHPADSRAGGQRAGLLHGQGLLTEKHSQGAHQKSSGVYTQHKVGSIDLCLSVQVCDIKEGLAGLGETIEEMRSVCRQLQSELKKSPDSSETSFEAEADALMDNWLDVSILYAA